MDTKKISSLQLGVLSFILCRASFFPIASSLLIGKSSQDTWISILLGGLLGVLFVYIYLYIHQYDKEKNIIEINTTLFGKVFGNIINILIVLGVIISASVMILGLCNFVFSNYVTQTPMLFVSLLFIVVVAYAVIKGIEPICRTAQITTLFGVILFVISTCLLIYYVDINSFKPILSSGFDGIFESSYHFILFAVSPIFMLTIIPQNYIIRKKHYKKSVVIGYIVGVISLLVTFFTTYGILNNITILFEFPEYMVLKQIEYFQFIERIENILSLKWIFEMFIFTTFSLYFLRIYIKNTFKIKKEKTGNIVTILFSILLFLLSSVFFTNSIIVKNLIFQNYYYITVVSFIIIPMFVFLKIKFQKKTKQKRLIN